MKQCKIITADVGDFKIKLLLNKETGVLRCWKNGRKCSSNCVAWRESHRKIKCIALPKNKNSSTIIAILEKRKKIMEYQKEIENVSQWMKEYLKSSGCKGYVILISGGIDSAVVASLCCKAVGPENVIGVSLPCETRDDMENDATDLANNLGIELRVINLEKTYNAMIEGLIEVGDVAKENVKSRLRMVAGYGIANSVDYLVVGTGNKSEDTISYFTKYGDGGVDILPIYNYYKTEVYKLAELMPEIPNSIKTKAPSADLSSGQTDEKDIGMPYSEIDKILKGLDPNDEQSLDGIDDKKIEKIKDMIKKGKHKNEVPPRYEKN